MDRAQAIRTLASFGVAGLGALVAAKAESAAALHRLMLRLAGRPPSHPDRRNLGMMGTRVDISAYVELFDRHRELTRTVKVIPGGVRTITESDAPELVAQLQAHVSSMYGHLDRGLEVTCMSQSLPLLFRNAGRYKRHLTLTTKGVAVTETSSDPRIVKAIREHAREVTGFVREGMQAMMSGGMGAGMMGG